MSSNSTIVTACDDKFVWGAVLLGLSLRFYGIKSMYHVLGYDLCENDVEILQSIPDTVVFPTTRLDERSVCTQKPMAILTAKTDIIVWMDADCLAHGNLEPFFVCPDGKLQIRFRGCIENASVYRNYYGREDRSGDIPKKVLSQWKDDVNDLKQSQISSVCQTNCFVLTKAHLPFISLWQSQMEKVIPLGTKGVYASDSVAYSMTDESVLNSLFAFSSQAPQIYGYLMDKDPNAYCIHFGLSPKPWEHWTKQAFSSYHEIQHLIHWAIQQKIKLPKLTSSLKLENKNREFLSASIRGSYRDVRYQLSSIARKSLKMLKY